MFELLLIANGMVGTHVIVTINIESNNIEDRIRLLISLITF